MTWCDCGSGEPYVMGPHHAVTCPMHIGRRDRPLTVQNGARLRGTDNAVNEGITLLPPEGVIAGRITVPLKDGGSIDLFGDGRLTITVPARGIKWVFDDDGMHVEPLGVSEPGC